MNYVWLWHTVFYPPSFKGVLRGKYIQAEKIQFLTDRPSLILSLWKITKHAGTENDTICLPILSASGCFYTSVHRLRWLDSQTAQSIKSGAAPVCHLVYNSLLCTYGFLYASQSATLIHCKGNRNTLKQLLLWREQFSTTAPEIDVVLCYGFTTTTKSFDSNVAGTETIIDVVSCCLIAWHQHM